MTRRIILIVLAAAAVGLWWKYDEARGFVVAKAPALAAYLPGAGPQGRGAPQTVRGAPAALPVVVTTVATKPVPVTIEAVGTVQSIASIQIKARIDSQIATVKVEEGAKVKEGDLLLMLDSRALAAQLSQADALVAKDRAQIEQARRDLARAEELLAKRITTEVQRDTAATSLKVLQAQLAADEAQRANLAAALSYTEVRAPVSGRIGSIAQKAGATVKAADTQPMMTVNQIDPIFVSFAIPQTSFPDVRKALAAGKVSVEAKVGGGTTTGIIAFTENTVDPATGTVLAKAVMPNSDERLWPGTFVAVRVVLGVEAAAITVPSSAVQIGQQGAYVFVVRDNDTAAVQPVTVARTIGQESVISAGLAGGEKVVTEGQLRLVQGATVQVQQPRSSDGVAKGAEPQEPSQRRS